MNLTDLRLIGLFFLLMTGAPGRVHALSPPGVQAVGVEQEAGFLARFTFDGTTSDAARGFAAGSSRGMVRYVEGLEGQALRLRSNGESAFVALTRGNLSLGRRDDFSVRFWTRTVEEADKRVVLLSQKEFIDNSLASQKEAGWVFYVSGGTWAWNMGSGTRRITYEREKRSAHAIE